ncbi:hypothetical protein [Shewanella sp. GXUN23E]
MDFIRRRIWSSGELEDWFVEVVEQHFYLGVIDQRPVVTGFLDEE